MTAIRAFIARWRGLFAGEHDDRDLAEELQAHLEMQIEDNLRSGMTPEEARREALLKSGGVELSKELYRDRRGLPAVEALLRDLRNTLRLLRRNPAFVAAAVASLALGIGVNASVFTLLDQLLLQRLPVAEPHELVMIWSAGESLGDDRVSNALSYPMYQDLQRHSPALSHVFCRFETPLTVAYGGRAERVQAELVSGNYFQALGAGPAAGRVFSPAQDDRTYAGHPVVVLSHQYWVSRFGADPAVVGSKILVNSYPMVVVGISAPGFFGLDPARSPQIRVPIQMKPLMTPGWDDLGNRRGHWVQVFGRMNPGYTPRSTQASLEPLFAQTLRAELSEPALRRVPQQYRTRFLAQKLMVEPASKGFSETRQSYATALMVLMGIVGLVLVVTCFSVANLLLARAAARQKEIAVRMAIGASRRQLLRQLSVESLFLSGAGGALGLLLSFALTRMLLGFWSVEGTLHGLRAEPDWRVLAFTAALVLLTALLFGLAPASQTVRLDLWSTLKEAARSTTGSRGSVPLRKALVAAQVALSFLLLAGAGLFVRTLANLRQADPGFRDIGNLITFQVNPALSGYSPKRQQEFYNRALDAIRSLPGVRSAGYAMDPVLHGSGAVWDNTISVEDNAGNYRENAVVLTNGVSPAYFETMGVRVSEGRDFDGRDAAGRVQSAIVNRAFARRFFPGRSPLGKHLRFGGPLAGPAIEIVGVVQDSFREGPREGVRSEVFLAFAQLGFSNSVSFYVRTPLRPESLLGVVRREVGKLDPAIPLYEMKTLRSQLDATLGTDRLLAALSTLFAALATVLAAVGLYGVMTLVVARRTGEVGLRMALGARPGQVLWMVIREALSLFGIGLAAGLPFAYLLGRCVSSRLFGIAPADLGTTVLASITLATVVVGAAVIPARRACTIDPVQALRQA